MNEQTIFERESRSSSFDEFDNMFHFTESDWIRNDFSIILLLFFLIFYLISNLIIINYNGNLNFQYRRLSYHRLDFHINIWSELLIADSRIKIHFVNLDNIFQAKFRCLFLILIYDENFEFSLIQKFEDVLEIIIIESGIKWVDMSWNLIVNQC